MSMAKQDDVSGLIRRFALQNAIFHGGKADRGAVLGKLIGECPDLKKEIRNLMPLIEKTIAEVDALSPEVQKAQLSAEAPELLIREKKEKSLELPDLDGANEGAVVMRLAPYPSGPLHIGNARMVILNDEYVRKYRGKLLLVFDDTIGSEEKTIQPEAYGMIQEALDWLGVRVDGIYYKSDRLEIFYEWAEKLIVSENAYVCECPSETLRENRASGTECAHRARTVNENLDAWKKMLDGSYPEGAAILRIKTDMRHKNPAFRDRALFRIKERNHPRTGNKYRVWPLLEFSWGIDDHLLGMTHVLRGKDLVIEDEMEKCMWNLLGLSGARFIHYGMLRIKESKLSKSKSMAEVKSGIFTGWDDPRTWSLQSLRRRGIRPEAVRRFILQFGVSLADIEVPAENLYSENRRLIDADARRLMFVPNPRWLTINGLPESLNSISAPNHPERPELGRRDIVAGPQVAISNSDYEKFQSLAVRLKDFCNVSLGSETSFISREVADKPDAPKIQWVAKQDAVNVSVVMEDGSLTSGVGESAIASLKSDDVVQFERFGFVSIGLIEKDEDSRKRVTAYFAHR